MRKILRVFPHKTSYTPEDVLTFCANGIMQVPMLSFYPNYDEVHISCIFTWDKEFCEGLKYQFEQCQDKPVKIGGPAFNSPTIGFDQGLYIKKNIIFTSRGCNNNCPWCIVPKIEGKLVELPVVEGNIIQDNNFLQTSKKHKEMVFEMLKGQKQICFKGGLEPDLIDDHFIAGIKALKIKELWLACDTDGAIKNFEIACKKLVDAGFTRDKIKCYALIGDDMERNEKRLRKIFECGAMPFAQLYRDFTNKKTTYSKEWNQFARQWQRPAAIKAHINKGTNFDNFNGDK